MCAEMAGPMVTAIVVDTWARDLSFGFFRDGLESVGNASLSSPRQMMINLPLNRVMLARLGRGLTSALRKYVDALGAYSVG